MRSCSPIVLSPTAILDPRRQAFTEEEIDFFSPHSKETWLYLAGFPNHLLQPPSRYDLGPELGGHTMLDLGYLCLKTHSTQGNRTSKEPPERRGVHVYLAPEAKDLSSGEMKPLVATEGMSGGPLVRFPQQKGPVLVGLARSRVELDHHDGSYTQWCEPAIEAVRLLRKHPNPQVVAAAMRIVARVSAPATFC